MKKWLWLGLGILAFLVLAYLGMSAYFSEQILVSTRDTLADGLAQYGDPAANGLPAPQEVTVAANGETLAGWLFERPNARCGLLFSHGFTNNRYEMLAFTKLFQTYNCTLLLTDTRAFGASTGQYHTFGALEHRDTLALLDWFEQRTGLTDPQIGLVGVSYGAANVLLTAASRPDLAFVLADSPYSNMYDIVVYQAKQLYPSIIELLGPGAMGIAGLRAGFNPWSVNPAAAAASIRAPVLILHEQADNFIPIAMSESVARNLRNPLSEFHPVTWSGEHAQSIRANPDAYRALVESFLSRAAPAFGQ